MSSQEYNPTQKYFNKQQWAVYVPMSPNGLENALR